MMMHGSAANISTTTTTTTATNNNTNSNNITSINNSNSNFRNTNNLAAIGVFFKPTTNNNNNAAGTNMIQQDLNCSQPSLSVQTGFRPASSSLTLSEQNQRKLEMLESRFIPLNPQKVISHDF